MDQSRYIGPKIKLLSTALGQEINRSTAALDLTGSQSFFLCYLVSHRDQPVYPRDLEKAFDFTHPTVSGILRRMETKGFIYFQQGEHDRRCKQIMLTEKALQCHDAMLQHIQCTETAATNGLTQAEIDMLCSLLDRVIGNLGAASCCKPTSGKEETND